MRYLKIYAVIFAFTLLAAACGNDSSSSSSPDNGGGDTADTADSGGGSGDAADDADHDEGPARVMEAPAVDGITVDGDAADWADVPGLDMTLEPITNETVPENHDATVKVAHDADNVYVLFQVNDDYNWDPEDGHLSAAAAVEWGIDANAEEHMGATDADREVSVGMVDIWHWELECGADVHAGGANAGPGDGDPGNDSGCNFDDEWATHTKNREDDNTGTGENSLDGVWTHSNPVADGEGMWTFEMSRPMQTGDEQDAQFTVGETAKLALAYWDPDNSASDGWDDDEHVVSANQGWIEVNFK